MLKEIIANLPHLQSLTFLHLFLHQLHAFSHTTLFRIVYRTLDLSATSSSSINNSRFARSL